MLSIPLSDEQSALNKQNTTAPEPLDGHFTERGMVILLVGEKGEKFDVHKALLCEKSKFFAKCLQPGFVENETGRVVLHEESAKSVRIMVEWLYENRIANLNMDSFDLIAGTYKMADKFMMAGLKNILIDKFRAHEYQKNIYSHGSSFCKLYNENMTGMPLHKYTLHKIVFSCMTYTAAWNREKRHREAIEEIYRHPMACRDFVEEILAFKEVPYANPAAGTGCLYHDHADDKACSADGW